MPVSPSFWEKEAEMLYRILFPDFTRMAKQAAKNGAEMLPNAVEGGISWALVNEAAISWASQYTAVVVSQITTTSMVAFSSAFEPWYRSGQPLSELVDTLKPYYGPVRAEMVAVTEVTRAFAEGNILSWKQSGVVDGIRWMTAQDELVCPICAPLANREGTLDAGVDNTIPPAHVRCRCYLQPVVGTNAETTGEPKTGEEYSKNLYRGVSGNGPADPGDLGVGTYYSTSEAVASSYGTVIREFITLKNPYFIDSKTASSLVEEFGTLRGNLDDRLEAAKKMTRKYMKIGHDGFIVEGWDSPPGEYTIVVFPKNFKNISLFSPVDRLLAR